MAINASDVPNATSCRYISTPRPSSRRSSPSTSGYLRIRRAKRHITSIEVSTWRHHDRIDAALAIHLSPRLAETPSIKPHHPAHTPAGARPMWCLSRDIVASMPARQLERLAHREADGQSPWWQSHCRPDCVDDLVKDDPNDLVFRDPLGPMSDAGSPKEPAFGGEGTTQKHREP